MEADQFRNRLASVIGDDRYRQLLRALNSRCRWYKRFRYCDEVLLTKVGVVALSPSELFECVEPLLRTCELHHVELQPDSSGLAQRCRGAVTEFTIAQGESFPNMDCGPLRPGDPIDNFRDGLWFYPDCRVAEADWSQRAGRS